MQGTFVSVVVGEFVVNPVEVAGVTVSVRGTRVLRLQGLVSNRFG